MVILTSHLAVDSDTPVKNVTILGNTGYINDFTHNGKLTVLKGLCKIQTAMLDQLVSRFPNLFPVIP